MTKTFRYWHEGKSIDQINQILKNNSALTEGTMRGNVKKQTPSKPPVTPPSGPKSK
jgi:hypothetical protein